MKRFLTSNETVYRLLRTIVQAVIGVLIANMDAILGTYVLNDLWRPIIAAVIMAILSPVMAELGKHTGGEDDDKEE